MAISYKTGKVTWRGTPTILSESHSIPHHNLKPMFWLNASQTIWIPLHKPQPCTPLLNLEVHPPCSSPIFIATTLLQSHVSSTLKRHSHFPNKTLLKVVNFHIPNPPLAIGARTSSHLTKCDLDSSHHTSPKKAPLQLLNLVGHISF